MVSCFWLATVGGRRVRCWDAPQNNLALWLYQAKLLHPKHDSIGYLSGGGGVQYK